MRTTDTRYDRWPSELLASIGVDRVHKHPLSQDWEGHPSTMPWMRFYVHPEMRLDNGRPAHYFYPSSNESIDYWTGVADFLVNFSQDRQISPDELLRELTVADGAVTPRRQRDTV